MVSGSSFPSPARPFPAVSGSFVPCFLPLCVFLPHSLWDSGHRDDGDTSERIKSSAQLRLRNEVTAVPVTPRREDEVHLGEPADASPADKIADLTGSGALDTPDTECAETPASIFPDTAGGSESVCSSGEHAAPSKDLEGVDESVAVNVVGTRASPSKSKKRNRKMKNLVKPAPSPAQGDQPTDGPAEADSGRSEPAPVVSETV